jgi:putative membrane protein
MQAVVDSFLSGFPVLMLHSSVTLAMLATATVVYIRITPYDDIALIRDGNQAVAVSLSAAVLGLALPLAFCMATSVNVWDIVIWGAVTLFLQLVAYRVVDLLLRGLPQRIQNGEVSAATFLASVKLSVAAVNAAAVVG